MSAGDGDRGRLFSGWRLFFERMADNGPTVLVFEDIQWADQALLDFIEYLMEWSRDHPLLVVTLARPELFDRPSRLGSRVALVHVADIGAARPRDDARPGRRHGTRPARIRSSSRSSTGPKASRCTPSRRVRMLLDRGLLERRDGQMVAIGEVESLEIPETLHALAAARLDALGESERKLVQDAAVLGKTFQVDGLAAVSGLGRGSSSRSGGAAAQGDLHGRRTIRDRRTRASTASSRSCCAPSPTRRSAGATARPATWPPPGTWSPCRPGTS